MSQEAHLRSTLGSALWAMLAPEMKVTLLLFFEAGDDGLSPEQAQERFAQVWPMPPEKIEQWRAVARYGSASVCH